MKQLLAFVIAFLGGVATDAGQDATFKDVTGGMKCAQNSFGDMECNYRVGRSLHFAIAGVGRPDASIYFYAASFDGDYYAIMGLSHPCVVVKPGRASGDGRIFDIAFVSPHNGKVYSTWETCRDGK